MLDSLYLEQNVIGALLIQPECYEAAAELSPDDFLVPEYAELFRAIQRRNEAGDPADAPSVLMDASSRNDNVTSKIMTDCMEVVVTTANIDVWVAGMRDASMGRKLRDLGEELRTAELSPQDALRAAQEAVTAIQDGAVGLSGGLEVSEAVKCLKNRVDKGFAGGPPPYVKTGLQEFDRLLGGGLINGGFHIVAARPGKGKSALAMQIALNAAKRGVKVLYISLEMSPDDCTSRLTANIAGISSRLLMFGGTLTEAEYAKYAEASAKLSELPIVFNRRTGMDMRGVTALAYKERPGLIVLDHIGLLEQENKKATLYESTTKNSRSAKLLAMRMNIPLLCLCQLNRAGASDRGGEFRATMANLRESGAIEQDADTVTLLHRPCEKEDRGEWDPDMLELYLDKNRRGPTGVVRMAYFPNTGRIVK
uniref:DNA 5'-3' helicase n=1 Tax=Phage sp. ctcqm2 TaxID=2828007 RepID=A0A8S5ST45_9VIRU|nr:MAG TPA: Helicase, ATPase, REPLICATION [Phage sp. ctcqm2]